MTTTPKFTVQTPYHEHVGGRATVGSPRCCFCGRTSAEIPGYGDSYARHVGFTSGNAMARADGTYNVATNRFACDECYLAAGAPVLPERQGGWKAP